MRSKEILEREKNEIYYYDLVKKSINDLYLLRTDKRKTYEYFNRYLYADVRCRAETKIYNGDISVVDFEIKENEMKHTIAFEVRNEILSTIKSDESFIYAYNIIVNGENVYLDYHKLDAYEPKTDNGETLNKILETIRNYKEDYPHTNLCEYLLDADNKEYYTNKVNVLNKTNEWWLNAFNQAYHTFDNLRLYSRTPSDALEIVNSIKTGDDDLDGVIIEIVSYMVDNYNFDLNENQNVMLFLLSGLIKSKIKKSENDYSEDNDDDENNSDKTMNCSQQTKTILFVLSASGVNFNNTGKMTIARFIQALTGKNIQNIRKRMEIDYDNENDIKDLKVAANTLDEILPDLSEKIRQNIKMDI